MGEYSWRLKIRRAERHLAELEHALARHDDDEPCTAYRDTAAHRDPRVWVIRGRLSKQPSEDLPIIVGDVVHNIRSALDHLAVALAPAKERRHASFPLRQVDPWERDAETGEYTAGKEDRESFERAVRGMNPTVQAHIDRVQPYAAGYEAMHHPLGQLSSLDNADKHRRLIAIPSGIADPRLTISTPTFDFVVVATGTDKEGVVTEGGVLYTLNPRRRHLRAQFKNQRDVENIISYFTKPHPKVDLKLTGQPVVGVALGRGVAKLPGVLRDLIDDTIAFVIDPLERYV